MGKSAKALLTVDLLKDDGKYMSLKDMFLGGAEKIIKLDSHSEVVKDFRKQTAAAYVSTGNYRQKKLPLNNKSPKAYSPVDH